MDSKDVSGGLAEQGVAGETVKHEDGQTAVRREAEAFTYSV